MTSFRPSRFRQVAATIAAGILLAGTVGASVAQAAGSTGTVTGALFADADADGVRDAGEAPFADRTIYAFDESTGQLVAGAGTAADGSFSIAGLAPGSYRIEVAAPDWWELRDTWVPTTTGTVWFRHHDVTVSAGASTSATFGLRTVERSTTPGAPLSSATASDGLRVDSYVDAVTAAELVAALDAGGLRGGEASTTTLRFGLDSTSYTVSSVAGAPGSYRDFSATVWVSYDSWLDDRGATLFHEYGHAWATYHDRIVQQDGGFAGYLDARGISGDGRLDTSHAWSVDELIAEDYRQLFGSPDAALVAQENRDLPAAADVAGLEAYLSGSFVTAPDAGSGGTGGGSEGGGDDPEPPAPAPLAITDLATIGGTAPAVAISFELSRDAAVTVQVIDHRGRVVRTVLDADRPAGSVAASWDRLDDRGRSARDGDYRIEVTASDGGDAVVAATVVTINTANDDSGTTSGGGGGKGKKR